MKKIMSSKFRTDGHVEERPKDQPRTSTGKAVKTVQASQKKTIGIDGMRRFESAGKHETRVWPKSFTMHVKERNVPEDWQLATVIIIFKGKSRD